MVDIDKVTFSTKPLTLKDMIINQRMAAGDYVAVFDYLLARTNLTEQEVLDLDLEELAAVLKKGTDATNQAMILQQIGKGLEDVRAE